MADISSDDDLPPDNGQRASGRRDRSSGDGDGQPQATTTTSNGY